MRAVAIYWKSILLCPAIDRMDTTRIDLNLLVTLEALLAERNVTKAAARIHLSQPAVSAQLSRLRALFDDPLLVPAHRGMTPTVKALELLGPVRRALDELRGALQTHREFFPARAKLTTTLACTDYIQAAVVMPLMVALREKAPGLRIAVRHLNPAVLDQQLASGEVDLAIATPDFAQPHLRIHHLFDETYVLIGRRDHPRLRKELTPAEFAQLEHVIVSPSGGRFRTPVDDALAALGHQRTVVMSAASFLFVPKMVSTSDMVALVPRRLLQSYSDQLTIVDIPWLSEHFDVGLIWHERSHGHAGQRWLRDLIIELTAAPTDSSERAPPLQQRRRRAPKRKRK